MDQVFDRGWQALCWAYDVLIGVWGKLSQPEKILLLANLCFAAVGAYASYLFYVPSRGPIIGGMAATAIECTFLGAAGVAVKHKARGWLSTGLILVGFVASVFFGVMVGLRDVFPAMFGGLEHAEAIVWPSQDQWIVLGVPAIFEGLIPSLCSLLLSLFLHNQVSHKADDLEQAEAKAAADFMPYSCPFCSTPVKTPAALWGHYGRCAQAMASTFSDDEKKAIIRKAIEDGKSA